MTQQTNGLQPDWNEEDDNRLCDLIADGASFAQAGDVLGRSRQSCKSRFNRIRKSYGEQGE